MSDAFTTLDTVDLFIEENEQEVVEVPSCPPPRRPSFSSADAESIFLTVEEVNDLPVDYERRTQGGGGLTWFCVIA
uniref:Phb3.2.42 n=1 Tax=Coprinopsis cinerea TaxID=5346 RepID=Q9UVM8_COPCI|nr:Phb3.2.42 [Coprinopsis cinerea]